MTIQSRNRILQISAFISLIINGFLAYRLYLIRNDIALLYNESDIISQKWWFFVSTGKIYSWILPIFSVFFLSIISLLSNAILNIYFRKTSSQEMFYFRLFLLTLSFTSLRVINFFIIKQHYGMNYHVLLTRISYFLQLLGHGCLFLSGIAIFDKKFQKMSTIFLSVLITSLVISVIIPINRDFYLGSLLNPLTDEVTFFMFYILFQILILFNFLLYAYYRKSRDNLAMAFGVLMVLLANEMSFFLNITGLICLILIMPLGIFLFSRKIFNLYLWR